MKLGTLISAAPLRVPQPNFMASTVRVVVCIVCVVCVLCVPSVVCGGTHEQGPHSALLQSALVGPKFQPRTDEAPAAAGNRAQHQGGSDDSRVE